MDTEFTAFVDLRRGLVFNETRGLGEVISNHRPGSKVLSIRALINGAIYSAVVRRRNGPSRALFRRMK